MKRYKFTHTWSAIKTLFVNIFGNKCVFVILDIIFTLILSIHTSNIDFSSENWVKELYVYVGLYILINIICILADYIKNKQNRMFEYFSAVCEIQNKLNSSVSTKLYRVNKKVTTAIKNNMLEKGAINSIADFQSLSFDICNELHQFITNYYNCRNCEITIFQRFKGKNNKDFVTMIAYKNSQNSEPHTYGTTFRLSAKRNIPVFVKIFKDANAEIKILHTKKLVQSEFSIFNNSSSREKEICQYIGIPIRTNRNMVEVLLQIDVSEKHKFGRRYKTVKQFAEDIIMPFRDLIYCSYERDLILNKFYDVLEENISNKKG